MAGKHVGLVRGFFMKFSIPCRSNKKLEKLVGNIRSDVRLEGYWTVANVNAIDRMAINDHGPVHSKIVANSGLRLFRIINSTGVKPSVVEDYEMTVDDAEVVIVLAAVLHDLGHAVHRHKHEEFAVNLAPRFIEDLLEGIYGVAEESIIEAETLHAIYAHKTEVEPLTLEGGIIKVADALDMEEGRARIPFSEGEITIHSVSALSIERVTIERGEKKPVRIEINISNSAGIFQLDNLFKRKLKYSGIQDYIETKVKVRGNGKSEKKIVDEYEL